MINPFKTIVIFLTCFFLSILYNIILSIYIIRYKSDIKILSFLRNISNCFLKKSQNF